MTLITALKSKNKIQGEHTGYIWVSAIWSDVVRLLWSKADAYDGPQHCTLQYGPDLVLLGISDLVRFTPIWSDLVIRVTR